MNQPEHIELPQVKQRRIVSDNRFLQYVEDDLHLASGQDYTYYSIDAKQDAVLVIPVCSDGTILVEEVFRQPHAEWFIEFPAGGIEKGETPEQAAQRELLEETGYEAAAYTYIGSCAPIPGLVRLQAHIVVAQSIKKTSEPNREEMELLRVHFHQEQELWDMLNESACTSSFLPLGLAYYQQWKAKATQ